MNSHNLGDIVALNSHPYVDNLTSIIISGEPQFISPLMVVIETIKDVKDQYDEKTGDEITKLGNLQCRCIWYSSKSHQFEEAWISSKLLKHIKHNPNSIQNSLDESKQIQGRLVFLKSSQIEGAKLKSSLSFESNASNSNKDKNITNPLLSFLCPVMQAVQVIEVKGENKDAFFDPKTGKQKRFASKFLIKCKWYNPNDKISEKLLPIESLELLPLVSPTLLERVQDTIESLGFYTHKNSIIQPKKMYSLNGIYLLKAYDYIVNKIIDIELNDTTELVDIAALAANEVPIFSFGSGDVLPDDYFDAQKIDVVKISVAAKSYIRIKYEKRNGENVIRTIKDFDIINIEEGSKHVIYLKGYDMTKKDVRNFRIDKIETLQQLNISF